MRVYKLPRQSKAKAREAAEQRKQIMAFNKAMRNAKPANGLRAENKK